MSVQSVISASTVFFLCTHVWYLLLQCQSLPAVVIITQQSAISSCMRLPSSDTMPSLKWYTTLQYLLYSEHVLILILFPVQNREQFVVPRSYHGLRLLMLSATISWLTLGVASLIRTLTTWVGNYWV